MKEWFASKIRTICSKKFPVHYMVQKQNLSRSLYRNRVWDFNFIPWEATQQFMFNWLMCHSVYYYKFTNRNDSVCVLSWGSLIRTTVVRKNELWLHLHSGRNEGKENNYKILKWNEDFQLFFYQNIKRLPTSKRPLNLEILLALSLDFISALPRLLGSYQWFFLDLGQDESTPQSLTVITASQSDACLFIRDLNLSLRWSPSSVCSVTLKLTPKLPLIIE